MDIQYFGGNCLRITTKQATIVVDDTLQELGLKPITKSDEIEVRTNLAEGTEVMGRLRISQPGEYEVSNISVQGIAARAHTDETGKTSATMYKLTIDDTKILVVGHIYPELSDVQLEQIGMIDIMLVPVGGHGYTLDGTGALAIIKKVEPKVVIPTHYADKALKYPVPQSELSEALQQLSMEPTETVAKYKVKQSELPEAMQLIVLER